MKLIALPLVALMALATVACAKDGTSVPEGAVPAAKAASKKAVKAAPKPGEPHPGLLDPSKAQGTAPESFKAIFDTTKGSFTIQITRSWAPKGVDRFYNLVTIGYYEDVAFFRVIGGFMAQFGLHGIPQVTKAWRTARITDDPVTQSNVRGALTFAMAGPNTRTTQLFINFTTNAQLDNMGFAPFGKVVEGMDVVDSLHAGYGEGAPRGQGPSQGTLQERGNAYLKADFPKLDYIKSIKIVL